MDVRRIKGVKPFEAGLGRNEGGWGFNTAYYKQVRYYDYDRNEWQDRIAAAAQAILDVRERYLAADPACTLAILYNPETMPPDLLKQHQRLDALVDRQYGRRFASDAERVTHLFGLYAAAVKEC